MTRTREYTKEIHIKRLVKILSSNKPLCDSCPAAKFFSGSRNCTELWTNDPCEVCREFIELNTKYCCPCIMLNSTGAYNITIQKLKEIGITF